jgi:patatin-related protein
MTPKVAGSATELRLALVCYGGVSLAIYMHGVTKELHKLVRASRAFDELEDLDGPNPFAAGDHPIDTEAAYFEALRSLAKGGRRFSVSIDIIAGTSAGGINGVVLAKALARNAQQEQLKRLWIEEGDLKKLLRAPAIGGVRIRALIAFAKLLGRATKPTSPLRGELMSKLLIAALGDMDNGSSDTTLIPPQGELELFVTATDMHGFEVLVPSGVGGASQRDRYHAQVLEFRATDLDTGAFGPDATPALAFSARATSSFPGAFAPVSLGSFAGEVGRDEIAVSADLFRYHYEENGQRASDAWFADGGVLDNAPFDHVIDAIRRRRAQTEVLRRIIYIQPDPGRPLEDPRTRPEAPQDQGWLAGLWQSVAVVKGSHPILLELLKLRDTNWRIAQVGAIAETQMTEVQAQIDKALAAAGLNDSGTGSTPAQPLEGEATATALNDLGFLDSKDKVRALSDAMHEAAAAVMGPAWPTYQRLKVEAAGRRLADEIALRFTRPPDSGRSSFIRAAIAAWARARPEWSDRDSTELVALLGPVDIPYRERRIMFLLAGVNGLYSSSQDQGSGPPRDDLDRLKRHAWRLLEDLQTVPRDVVQSVSDQAVEFLTDPAIDSHLLDNPETFAVAHADDFNNLFQEYRQALINNQTLGDGSAPLWRIFEEETKTWNYAARVELLSRYLGFPLWDGIIFPTISLAELPQFTPIGVTQFSPLTATVLATPDGGKLKGVSLHHFGAFLDPDWRENDYLWGRLDSAELILRTLHEGSSATPQEPSGDLVPEPAHVALRAAGGHHLIDALTAVLATEDDLRGESVAKLRPELAQQIAELAVSLPPRPVS